MRLRTCLVSLVLLAAATAVAAPQASKSAATHDPEIIDAQGYQKLLEQYRGKPLLVNFWATWCEPCRDEYPMLNELAKQYGPQGFKVVGVSMDDDGDLILMRRFLARYKPIFPNYRKKGWRGETVPASDTAGLEWGHFRLRSSMAKTAGRPDTCSARARGTPMKRQFESCWPRNPISDEAGRRNCDSHGNLRSGYIQDEVEEYLYQLLPERDAVVAEMEDYAAQHDIPIIGPAVARIAHAVRAGFRRQTDF